MATVITIANLKGGSSKTTTAAYLAHALQGAGLSVLVVDADPQGSALRWAEAGEWPVAAVGMPVKNLHVQLGEISTGRDVVVIDTPPLELQAGIVHSALRAADLVVVTTAPTPMEIERLAAVRQALDDVAGLREDARPPRSVVLLTRTVARAASTGVWREALGEQGWHVLASEVRRLEAIAQAAGDPISDVGPYAAVANEMLDVALAEDDPSPSSGENEGAMA